MAGCQLEVQAHGICELPCGPGVDYSSFHLIFHYPNITPIYTLLYYSSFHLILRVYGFQVQEESGSFYGRAFCWQAPNPKFQGVSFPTSSHSHVNSTHMSYSLNSLKGDYIGGYRGCMSQFTGGPWELTGRLESPEPGAESVDCMLRLSWRLADFDIFFFNLSKNHLFVVGSRYPKTLNLSEVGSGHLVTLPGMGSMVPFCSLCSSYRFCFLWGACVHVNV